MIWTLDIWIASFELVQYNFPTAYKDTLASLVHALLPLCSSFTLEQDDTPPLIPDGGWVGGWVGGVGGIRDPDDGVTHSSSVKYFALSSRYENGTGRLLNPARHQVKSCDWGILPFYFVNNGTFAAAGPDGGRRSCRKKLHHCLLRHTRVTDVCRPNSSTVDFCYDLKFSVCLAHVIRQVRADDAGAMSSWLIDGRTNINGVIDNFLINEPNRHIPSSSWDEQSLTEHFPFRF